MSSQRRILVAVLVCLALSLVSVGSAFASKAGGGSRQDPPAPILGGETGNG
jgi:hypothetical protein